MTSNSQLRMPHATLCWRVFTAVSRILSAATAAGEYIAVEKLETDYSDTDIIEQIW